MQNYKSMLHVIRSQTLGIIAEITAAPKPTYTMDEQTISWESYLKQLQATVDWCNAGLIAEEPFEIRTTSGT